MPELTTTSGEVIDFDPAAVTAICDMDPDTGESVTCVYGCRPVRSTPQEPPSSGGSCRAIPFHHAVDQTGCGGGAAERSLCGLRLNIDAHR